MVGNKAGNTWCLCKTEPGNQYQVHVHAHVHAQLPTYMFMYKLLKLAFICNIYTNIHVQHANVSTCIYSTINIMQAQHVLYQHVLQYSNMHTQYSNMRYASMAGWTQPGATVTVVVVLHDWTGIFPLCKLPICQFLNSHFVNISALQNKISGFKCLWHEVDRWIHGSWQVGIEKVRSDKVDSGPLYPACSYIACVDPTRGHCSYTCSCINSLAWLDPTCNSSLFINSWVQSILVPLCSQY